MVVERTDSMFPEAFLQRLEELFPQGLFRQVLLTFSQPKHVGFRINQLKTSVPGADRKLSDLRIAWTSFAWHPAAGYVVPNLRERLLQSSLVASGEVYLQNPSSMLVALALGARPGEQILDLAAAPGGKTLLLAECMGNQGYLAAVDSVRKRFYQLRHQLELAGVCNARTFLCDGRSIGGKTPNRFDRVLLDAPCSGEARFRATDPLTWRYWSKRKIDEQSRKQRGLILSAIRSLRPGGTLIYSTCSFAPEENEAVVDFALRRMKPLVELAPVKLPIDNVIPGLTKWQQRSYSPSLSRAVRIVPNDLHDGFFLAKLRKLDGA